MSVWRVKDFQLSKLNQLSNNVHERVGILVGPEIDIQSMQSNQRFPVFLGFGVWQLPVMLWILNWWRCSFKMTLIAIYDDRDESGMFVRLPNLDCR